jgi:glycosyltransferase involved in cell wall biosynthesis
MSPNIEKVWISRPHNVPRFVESGLYDKIRSGSTQVIYDAEAIFSEREKIRCELFNQEFDKKIQEDEIELLSKADLVVSVSDKEKKLLSNHTDKKIFKVAHPMSFKNAEYDNFDNREDILFVGNMQGDRLISPNVDSIYYFMSSFGESLQKAGIPIRLVGAIDKEHQDNWESLGAICEGRVDDLKPFFDKAIISIAPTRFAAGIPHKVHESLAHGVPVMYTKLIGSQISEPLIENALIENLNPELLSNKAQLEDLFKEQIKGCTNDMSEDEFEYEIKKISQNT